MPKYGYDRAGACLLRTIAQLKWPIATIALILGLAYIMLSRQQNSLSRHSGRGQDRRTSASVGSSRYLRR